jgi:hypothetical protein
VEVLDGVGISCNDARLFPHQDRSDIHDLREGYETQISTINRT